MKRFEKTIAVTGGIGSGKSTACKILKENGFYIIDTDEITREISQPNGSAYTKIIKLFGPSILLKDKTLNKDKIKELILANPPLKNKLEDILHPLILNEVKRKIQALRENDYDSYIFVEVPLLFEAGWDKFFPHVLLVTAPIKKRIERIKQYRNMSSSKALSFIKSQLPDEKKKKLSTWIITNDKDIQTLKHKIKKFLKELES